MAFGSIKHISRLITVAHTLARHDALYVLDINDTPFAIRLGRKLASFTAIKKRNLPERGGERLALALASLGPAFIKLGQTLATRADLIGRDIASDLSHLQDRLPPIAFDKAKAVIERELGGPLEETFSSIDEIPVAAASIAQVHFATTTNGDDVAIKVLRPNIERKIMRDVAAFDWFAHIVEKALPSTRRLQPREVVNTLRHTLAIELDLRMEAAAAGELAENMRNEAGYRLPSVDWNLTSRRILVMEKIIGTPIRDKEALKAQGHSTEELAQTLVRVFLTQAIRDGFFHADLHQGNFLVEADGTLVALDFGIMGRLDKPSRRYLAEILWGFQTRNYRRTAEVHFDAGYVPRHHSVDLFAQALRAIAEPIAEKPTAEISFGKLFAQLMATTEQFDMKTQPQLLVLQRSMVMVEGLAIDLDETSSMWSLSHDILAKLIKDIIGPTAHVRDMKDTLQSLAGRLPWLAQNLDDVIDHLQQRAMDGANSANNQPRHSNAKSAVIYGLAGMGVLPLIALFLYFVTN